MSNISHTAAFVTEWSGKFDKPETLQEEALTHSFFGTLLLRGFRHLRIMKDISAIASRLSTR